jgi:hypothetical protein
MATTPENQLADIAHFFKKIVIARNKIELDLAIKQYTMVADSYIQENIIRTKTMDDKTTTKYVLETADGKFLKLEWGMCDTIEGIKLLDACDETCFLRQIDKETIDSRDIILKEYNAHWKTVKITQKFELE